MSNEGSRSRGSVMSNKSDLSEGSAMSDKSGHSTMSKTDRSGGVVNVSQTQPKSGLDYLKDLYQLAVRLEERIKKLEAEIQEILQRLRNKGKILVHPKDMPQIPLKKGKHISSMEKCLRKQANQEFLILKLSQQGGSDVETCTDNILTALMFRSLYAAYSLRGKKSRQGVEPKKAFHSLQIYEAVKGAALKRFPNADPTLIDTSIADYLRYSPFRKDRREQIEEKEEQKRKKRNQ